MRTALACVLCVCSILAADESPVRPIRLPVIGDSEPAPFIPPSPRLVTLLPADHFFVVESDVPLIVLHSPDGFVDVSADEGPIRLRGKFAGSEGKIESRTFASKHVYTIEGKRDGTTELILIPRGVESSDQIVRATVSINGFSRPPPGPGPEPNPEPKPSPTAENVSLDIVEDAQSRTADTAIVLNGLASWSEFVDAGNTWRIYDKNTTEPQGKRALLVLDETPLPALVIRDKTTAKPLRVMPLPQDFDTFKRLIAEVTGE